MINHCEAIRLFDNLWYTYYNVNISLIKITTRKALESLSLEGVIRKVKGKGAIVAKPKIEVKLFNRLIGTYQDLKDKGFKITNKILDFKIIESKELVRKELNLIPKEKVYRFERIRFLDNEPYHYSKTFMPQKICPNFDYNLLIKQSLIVLSKLGVYSLTSSKHKILNIILR